MDSNRITTQTDMIPRMDWAFFMVKATPQTGEWERLADLLFNTPSGIFPTQRGMA